MAKTSSTRRRQSKVVVKEVVIEEGNVTAEGQTESASSNEEKDAAPTESTEMKRDKENQDEQESQMDTVIEVKGSKSTVTVSWDKKNEEEEVDDPEKRTSGQMMDSGELIISSADATVCTETNKKHELQEHGANGKRKANSTVETSPSKKTKLINDGFCLFVGNLNNSKTYEDIKGALANYLMTQSLLVQDIRLDRSKKHAYVDLASEMDLTKALKLNGEMVLDKPMKIDKAKVKTEDKVKVKVKAPAEDKKAAKDARCLFLKNVPYNATKEDIIKIFHKAVDVRFPGGTESPEKGIAFVEFKNKAIAKKTQQKKLITKIQGRVLIVDFVGEANGPKVTKPNDDNKTHAKAAAPPNNTLFVSNLSYNVREKKLKKLFPKAVNITIPQSKGKSRGFAFVEFATVADAEKALQSSQNTEVCKREVRVEFCEIKEKSDKAKVLSKTLIVTGLAEKTSAETLKGAFEGALSARVIADKETGASKRFGFVDFESDENCKAVKKAMEDCEIDGSKVTVAYAKPKRETGPPGARGGVAGHPAGHPAGQKASRGGRGSRGGRRPGAGKLQDAIKEDGNKG